MQICVNIFKFIILNFKIVFHITGIPGTQSESLYGWQSVSMSGVEPTLWTLLHFQLFGSGICCPVSVGSPLWREAGSVFVSHSLVICLCINLIFTFLSFTHLLYIYMHYTIHIIFTRPLLFSARYSRLCQWHKNNFNIKKKWILIF
jgi:hypothetical protein